MSYSLQWMTVATSLLALLLAGLTLFVLILRKEKKPKPQDIDKTIEMLCHTLGVPPRVFRGNEDKDLVPSQVVELFQKKQDEAIQERKKAMAQRMMGKFTTLVEDKTVGGAVTKTSGIILTANPPPIGMIYRLYPDIALFNSVPSYFLDDGIYLYAVGTVLDEALVAWMHSGTKLRKLICIISVTHKGGDRMKYFAIWEPTNRDWTNWLPVKGTRYGPRSAMQQSGSLSTGPRGIVGTVKDDIQRGEGGCIIPPRDNQDDQDKDS